MVSPRGYSAAARMLRFSFESILLPRLFPRPCKSVSLQIRALSAHSELRQGEPDVPAHKAAVPAAYREQRAARSCCGGAPAHQDPQQPLAVGERVMRDSSSREPAGRLLSSEARGLIFFSMKCDRFFCHETRRKRIFSASSPSLSGLAEIERCIQKWY